MKSEEGNKATFSFVSNPGMESLRRLPEAKANKKGVLRVRCLRSVSFFHRLKGCFCELIEYNRKVPLRKIHGTFGTIPVKTGE